MQVPADQMRRDGTVRYESPPPRSWAEKVTVELERGWWPLQLKAKLIVQNSSIWPVPVSEVGRLLERMAGKVANVDQAGAITYRREDGSEWCVLFNLDEPVTRDIHRLAGRINAFIHHTSCRPADATAYLLCDERITLPYIVVETASRTCFSRAARVFVADVEAQAEEVREAWVGAQDAILGSNKRRRPDPGAYAMVELDANLAAQPGSTWRQRMERWNALAAQVEDYHVYSDDLEYAHRSYMNRVKALRTNYPALDELWRTTYSYRETVEALGQRDGESEVAWVERLERSRQAREGGDTK